MRSTLQNIRLNWFLAHFVLFVLLIYPAINNGFPLLISESGTYISTTKAGIISVDILNTYGLFVRHLSFSWNLWMLVILQAIIFLMVLKKFISAILHEQLRPMVFLGLGVFLTFFTSVDSLCSTISPMIFESISLMLIALVLLKEKLPKSALIVFIFTALFSYSSMLLGILLSFFALIYHLLRRRQQNYIRRSVLVLGISLSLPLVISTANYAKGEPFQLTRNIGVHLIAHFSELHLIEDYFGEKCKDENQSDEAGLNYCENKKYRTYFSKEGFLYEDYSPLYSHYPEVDKQETWKKLNTPYKKLALQIMGEEEFRRKYILKTLSSFFKQIQYVQNAQLPKLNLKQIISFKYPYNRKAYLNSKQYAGPIEYRRNELLESLIYVLLLMIFPVILYKDRKRNNLSNKVGRLLYLSLLLNAFIHVLISDAQVKYQLPLVNLLILIATVYVLNYLTKHFIVLRKNEITDKQSLE